MPRSLRLGLLALACAAILALPGCVSFPGLTTNVAYEPPDGASATVTIEPRAFLCALSRSLNLESWLPEGISGSLADSCPPAPSQP